MDRVKSQIHDLQGERRGHVSIACSQAFMVSLLPNEILKYQNEHPNVTFSLRVCTRSSAAAELQSFNADIAMVFDPELTTDFRTLACTAQSLHVQFRRSHPLNKQGPVRLRDCLMWPQALPTKNNGIRHILEKAVAARSAELNVAIESDNFYLLRKMVQQSKMISFTLPAGLDDENEALLHRRIDDQDLPSAQLHIAILKNRHLPVAAAKFAEQLVGSISD